jgi:hypothetical protein
MATPDVTAGTVMDGARGVLNDQDAQIYTNERLLVYLKTAFRELREFLEQSNIPVTNVVDSDPIEVDASSSNIRVGFDTTPGLPATLVEIRQAWWRTRDTNPWYPLVRKEFLPPQLEGIEYTGPTYWAWLNNAMELLPMTSDIDIKLQYIQQLTEPADENSTIGVINGQTFLEFRVAALAARYMMENPERANALDMDAQQALDRSINIENKAKQNIFVRRRPFRGNWKSRTPF